MICKERDVQSFRERCITRLHLKMRPTRSSRRVRLPTRFEEEPHEAFQWLRIVSSVSLRMRWGPPRRSTRGIMKLVTGRSIRMAAALMALATLGAAGGSAPTPGNGPGKLVALGDSFTANSTLLPTTTTNGCNQSKQNQPRLVASRLGIADVTDASCDGAQTGDIMGGSAPQINKVTSSASVVMVSIGGNDLGFSDIAVQCSKRAITFKTCQGDYVKGGTDSLTAKVAATRPKVDQVLAAVKSRAPQARVVLYGYPTLLPMTGSSTCLGMTFASSDVPYLRAKQAELNVMLKASAQAKGVTYVDVYGPSAGHDPCSSTPWVNKVIDIPPLHPTHRGQTAVGNLIADALS